VPYAFNKSKFTYKKKMFVYTQRETIIKGKEYTLVQLILVHKIEPSARIVKQIGPEKPTIIRQNRNPFLQRGTESTDTTELTEMAKSMDAGNKSAECE
jgi:hypothetical protein